MVLSPQVTAEIALEWEELMGRHRPARPKVSGETLHLVSFNTALTEQGVFMRMRTSGGEADIFLNAVVATMLAEAIRELGIGGKWMNEDDGSVIVKDPENLAHGGRTS